jgi:hypothetical protein
MAIRRKVLNYTVYSPSYRPREGYCADFRSAAKARRKARALGLESRLRRNVEFWNKGDKLPDWWVERVWELRAEGFVDITNNKSKGLP